MKSILITLLAAMIIGWDTLTIEVAVQQKKSQNDEGKNETTVTQTETEEEEKDFPLKDGQTIYEWNGIRLQSLYPHNRPEGYDNPVLSDTTAQLIIKEAQDMRQSLLHCGLLAASFSDWSALREWVRKDENCVRGDLCGKSEMMYYAYYAPEIDTMEKLENYIRLTFTEDSIATVEEYVETVEYKGKTAGISTDRDDSGITPALWGDFPTVFREESEDGKEVTIQYNIEVRETWFLSQLYTLQYDEVYGWRVKVTTHEQMMHLGY